MQRRIQPILARYQKKIERATHKVLADAAKRLKKPVSQLTKEERMVALGYGPFSTQLGAQFDQFFDDMRAAMGPELASIMTERSLELTTETGISFDAAIISEEALGWARDHAADLVTGVTDTTRKLVNQSVSTFIETPGMTRGDLEKLLAPAFGEHRASMIGVTEVTRAYSEATNQHQRLIRDEVGLEMRRIWQTLRDEITCPICGPKHGMPEEDWRAEFPNGPPAHPNCRCSTSLTMDDEATVRAEAIAKQTAREKLLREQVAGEKPGAVTPPIVGPTGKETRNKLEEAVLDVKEQALALKDQEDEAMRDLQFAWDQLSILPADSERYQEWNQRSLELGDKWTVLSNKRITLERTINQRLRRELYIDQPAAFEAKQVSRFTGPRKKNIELGVSEFRKMVGTGTIDDALVEIKAGGRGRSSAEWDGKTINLTTSAGTKTTIHELGHWLEFNDSEVQEKALSFYDSRTAGEKAEWLGDHYDQHEVTRRDKFLDPYMGKDYRRRSTEIVSMGTEYYWNDPLTFAREDPEYFDFIFDLLRGR